MRSNRPRRPVTNEQQTGTVTIPARFTPEQATELRAVSEKHGMIMNSIIVRATMDAVEKLKKMESAI